MELVVRVFYSADIEPCRQSLRTTLCRRCARLPLQRFGTPQADALGRRHGWKGRLQKGL